jgi:hypothetical protein
LSEALGIGRKNEHSRQEMGGGKEQEDKGFIKKREN